MLSWSFLVPDPKYTRISGARYTLSVPAEAIGGAGETFKLEFYVAEAPWSEAEWAVALRFDNPRATVPLLVLG